KHAGPRPDGGPITAWDKEASRVGMSGSGTGSERISAEFERIRRELGDLPGVVSSSARLRTMLQHLTKTLHPGVLNDCFYQAATAICRKRAKALGRPLPLHNMCLHCPTEFVGLLSGGG
ncbi:hypothetical protein M2283_010242, partial [Streptomyces pseudovenezuelae]|nr:hypothetical protein [Streptomyces pseudovenezuelae]